MRRNIDASLPTYGAMLVAYQHRSRGGMRGEAVDISDYLRADAAD